MAGALALRLVALDHGLPYVFNPDEALHFTDRAVAMFGHGLDPHYFQNPSAFTYLAHLALRLRFTAGWPLGSDHDLVAGFASDPTDAFLTTRALAVVLCLAGVVAVYDVGRRLWDPAAGVAAAAVLAFAFLPVTYSRLALTDVGAFAPVALATWAAVRSAEDDRRRWPVLAGVAVGVAVGFKYTAGLLVVPVAVAVLLRGLPRAEALRRLALAAAAAALAFLITTPFFLIDLRSALYELKVQSRSADTQKLGQAVHGPVRFYLDSLSWGLGWGACAAAAAGLAWQARVDRRRALLLALFPVLLFAYLCTAERSFARWLMPAYPVLALLAGLALARAAAAVTRRPALRAGVLAALLAAVLAQPVAADLRTARVLGREDTRTQARAWVLGRLPAGTKAVVEPAFPLGFFGTHLAQGFAAPPNPPGHHRGTPARFIRTLGAPRVDRYREAGFCTVVTSSFIRDRALAAGTAPVRRYYRRLDRQSVVLFRASPYRAGRGPVPFDFDGSTVLYRAPAYERPGPLVEVRRLRGCPA